MNSLTFISKIQTKELRGVEDVVVTLEEKEARVTYIPDILAITELASFIQNLAQKFSARPISDSCTVHIEGMTCGSCVKKITSVVEEVSGVLNCEVSLADKSAEVEFDPDVLKAEDVEKTINNIGTKVSVHFKRFNYELIFVVPSSPPLCTAGTRLWP